MKLRNTVSFLSLDLRMHNMACMSMNMFDFIFGWRKVSKCKKLIKSLHSRLNLLKYKRWCMARQLRNDIAQLIKLGHYQSAFNRVDQIYKEECIFDTYDILADFCKFISLHLSCIHRNRECPNKIKEAISSLIFASARCEDLPELAHIRKFFRDHYGERFEAVVLELHTKNHVNSEIRAKLSVKKVPDEVKYKLVEEITTTKLQTKPLPSELTSELHQEVVPLASELTSEMQQEVVPLASEFTSELHQEVVPLASELTSEMQQEVVPLASEFTSELHQEVVPLASEFTMHQEVQPLALEFTSELHQEATANQDVLDTGNKEIAHVDSDHTATQNDQSMTDGVDADSSSENSTTDVRPKIVYRDDIEELQSPLNYGENGKDQRVFVFRLSPIVPEVEIRKHRRFIDYEFVKSESSGIAAKGATKSRKISVLSVIECPSYYDKTPPRRRANKDNRKRSGMQPHISTPLSGHENMFVKQRASQDNRKRSGMQPHISTPLLGHENVLVKQAGKRGMCSRAFTMPPKRSTKCLDEKEMMRSKSFPVPPSSPHVTTRKTMKYQQREPLEFRR